MSVISKSLILKSHDGCEWTIPVAHIIQHRAETYGGDDSYKDTVELFESDSYEIEDWASNNMNWSDVEGVAIKTKAPVLDMQDIWSDGVLEVK